MLLWENGVEEEIEGKHGMLLLIGGSIADIHAHEIGEDREFANKLLDNFLCPRWDYMNQPHMRESYFYHILSTFLPSLPLFH